MTQQKGTKFQETNQNERKPKSNIEKTIPYSFQSSSPQQDPHCSYQLQRRYTQIDHDPTISRSCIAHQNP